MVCAIANTHACLSRSASRGATVVRVDHSRVPQSDVSRTAGETVVRSALEELVQQVAIGGMDLDAVEAGAVDRVAGSSLVGMHAVGDAAPAVELLDAVQARNVRIPLALLVDRGGLGDDQARAGALGVAGGHQRGGDRVGRAVARQWRHDHPVGKLQRTHLDRIEQCALATCRSRFAGDHRSTSGLPGVARRRGGGSPCGAPGRGRVSWRP